MLFHERRGAQLNVAASPGCCGVSPLKGWRRTVRGLVADRSQAGEGFPLQVKTETFAEMAPNLSPRPFRSAGPEDGGTARVPVEFAERRVGLTRISGICRLHPCRADRRPRDHALQNV